MDISGSAFAHLKNVNNFIFILTTIFLVNCRAHSSNRTYIVSHEKVDSLENSRLLSCIAT